ncbi:hypothetical protein [Sulfuricurvum sp. IAE1]|nr:hypothetical protein [Sulfuricurvum sp. IAE1]
MEDQFIGAVVFLIVLAVIGIGSRQQKRRYGENFPGAKYSKAKR